MKKYISGIIKVMSRGSNWSVDPEGIRNMGEIEFSDFYKNNAPLRKFIKNWMIDTKQHTFYGSSITTSLEKFLDFLGYEYPYMSYGRDAFANLLDDIRSGELS